MHVGATLHTPAHLEPEIHGWSFLMDYLGYPAAPQLWADAGLPKSCHEQCQVEHLQLLLNGDWDGGHPQVPW